MTTVRFSGSIEFLKILLLDAMPQCPDMTLLVFLDSIFIFWIRCSGIEWRLICHYVCLTFLSFHVALKPEEHKPLSTLCMTFRYVLDILCSLSVDAISDSFVKIVAKAVAQA